MKPENYQPGGSVYEWVKSVRGQSTADRLAAAYARDPYGPEVDQIVSDARTGKSNYDTRGTLALFGNYVTTDPLGAPLESANRQIGKAVMNFLKNPWVLITVVLLIAWKLGLLDQLLKKVKA